MTSPFRFVYITALAFIVSSCASTDTTKLHVGMTRDEVVAVMGKPEAVSAAGNVESLSYSLEETASFTSSSSMVQPMGSVGSVTSSAYMGSGSSRSVHMQPYYVRLVDGKVESYGYGRPNGANPILPPRPISKVNPTPSLVPAEASGSIQFTEPNGTLYPAKLRSHNKATATANRATITAIEVTTNISTPALHTVAVKLHVAYALTGTTNQTLVLGRQSTRSNYYIIGRRIVPPGSGEVEFEYELTVQAWTYHPTQFGAFLHDAKTGMIFAQDIQISDNTTLP